MTRCSEAAFRRRAALAALGACALALALASAAEPSARAPAAQGSASMGEAAAAVVAGMAPEEALKAQGLEPFASAEPPEWFADELLGPAELGEGYANASWSAVGLLRECDAQSAFEEVSSALARRGWLGCESGLDGMAAFTKEEGRLRWVLVQAVESDGWSTVVLQASPSSS